MGISALFDTPYYSGTGTSNDVPSMFPVALNGRPYILDLHPDLRSQRFVRESIPILRNQANTTNLPDESSLNPEDLWRRSQNTWYKGAGQKYLDKADSDAGRFSKSMSINCWDRWQISLLHYAQIGDTFSTITNTSMVSTSSRIYVTLDNVIRSTTTVGGSLAVQNAAAGASYLACTTDGYGVYFAKGTDGIYLTNRTVATAAVSWVTGTVNLVRYVQGRLMAAAGNLMYNVTTSTSTAGPTALPAAMYTHPNPDWVWTDFAEGQGQIYASGFSGDKSIIYRTSIKADGTALDVPVAAGLMPDGELVNCMQGYLGYLIIGTTKGVRFCTSDGQGNLIVGPLLNTGTLNVQSLEPQDRFVWFGWPSDGTFAGLGRIDLSVFTGPQAPAFATDLTVDPNIQTGGVATVPSIATFKNYLVFNTLSAGGFTSWYDVGGSNPYALSGYYETGSITFGIPDPKVAMWVDVRMDPLPANTSVSVSLSSDGGAYSVLGTVSAQGAVNYSFSIPQKVGNSFQLRVTLASTAGASTPVVTRVTMRAYAAPNRAEQWTLPILLHETVLANGGVPMPMTILDEVNRIRAMVSSKSLVTYQEGIETHAVFVEDYTWTPHHPTADAAYWNGVMVVTLKETSS